MLPEKATAMRTLLQSELADPVTTRRRLSRLCGKSIHYCSAAVQFLSFAAPSLSQAIHCTEDAAAIDCTPALRDESLSRLLYDAKLALSPRAARALRLAIHALADYTPRGIPMWPLIASSLYGAFLDGCLRNLEVLVITFDASVHGLGACARTSPCDPGLVLVGGFRELDNLLDAPYLAAFTQDDGPAAQSAQGSVRWGLCSLHCIEALPPPSLCSPAARGQSTSTCSSEKG